MRSLLRHPPSRQRRRALRRVLLAAGLAVAASRGALANPNGGVVRGGVATITGQGTSRVDVTQQSQGAVLSWEHFDIAPGEVTNFHQPNANATAINRILQQDPSKIFGALNANGNVYLINPNGFLFGATATINTHSFAAMTSLDAEGLKKLSGGFDASAASAPGAKIENHGAISSGDGGFVYLIAPRVENGKDGVITTPQGEVLLAAGATVTLTDDPSGVGLGIRYTAPGAPGGEAVNLGKLVANGGFARMRADFVRQNGVVQANAVRERAGKIELYAATSLELGSGSVTEATGGRGSGAGGEISAKSDGDAHVAPSALVDVSGGRRGGDGGSAELSARGNLALGGTLRAGAAAGSKRGKITIDPTILTIPSGVNLQGAGAIVAEASQRIDVSSNAIVNLADSSQAGDGKADRQSLTLRSGGDINFGQGAGIVDDGSGAGGQKIWDVNLVAGADLANAPGTTGSIYLSGAIYNSSGAFVALSSNNGEVALTHGDLTVRATGDLVVGNGGGLIDQTGRIDVEVGRDVIFHSKRDTDQNGDPVDGVIQNGSGDIDIVAGRDILLADNANTGGNAAIRTRGVSGTDPEGNPTISDGGSIFIQAGRDVDAGVGNRWVEPGPNYTPAFAESALGVDQVPAYDPLPVVSEGILGIGTEAGGNVTIVAGGDVRTGASSVTRSGATAAGLPTQYNGSHIGIFGQPVSLQPDVFSPSNLLKVPIEGAPESRLTVVAGRAIEGDFMVRNGEGSFRAGYALRDGETAQNLDPAQLDAALVESADAQLPAAQDPDPAHPAGWFGTLSRPVTVDTMDASIDAIGRNGVAIRGVENPSLVYPPASGQNGVSAVPTWNPEDSVSLRSTQGDVILVGNDINLATLNSTTPQPNDLVRVLPPNVHIETDRGDLVLLNDFVIYPSHLGGLDLQIAGTVRTANFSASSPASLGISVATVGASAFAAPFVLPAGTRFTDPASGVTYTLTNQINVIPAAPAMAAIGTVSFVPTPQAAAGAFTVPAGTLVKSSDGQVFAVVSDAVLLPPAQRLSQGQVTFYVAGGGSASPILIPQGTQLVGPDGSHFEVSSQGFIPPGQPSITLNVQAATDSRGVDVSAFSLSLSAPIAGVDHATNLLPTVRPTRIDASVQAVNVGLSGNVLKGAIASLVQPLPGIQGVSNAKGFSGGTDDQTTGSGTSSGGVPVVRADLLGPVGQAPPGSTLILDPATRLPAGVDASQIVVHTGDVVTQAGITPTLYRQLTADANGVLRPDPSPGVVVNTTPSTAWQRDGVGISAQILQSDADPDIDGRALTGSFQYSAYLVQCHSGGACQQGVFGTGPTHADDPNPSMLRALGGFDRVIIQLAKPALALTGDPGPDGVFGTADDGSDGSIVDFALLTQHSKPTDVTEIWVPIGNASFGADSPAPGVDANPYSGLQVAGPGTALLLVGVVPNPPDGTTRSAWLGSPESFVAIDESQRLYRATSGAAAPTEPPAGTPGPLPPGKPPFNHGHFNNDPEHHHHHDHGNTPPGVAPTSSASSTNPIFSPRTVIAGSGDGVLTPAETPYVPTGRGGSIRLAGVSATIPAAQLPDSLGISTIGNVRNPNNPGLPIGSADLFVAADQTIDLNARGSIETYQGGRLVVESVEGSLEAGTPPPGYTGRRGIVTLFRAPNFGDLPPNPSGGGPIGIDVGRDFSIGGLAVAALSGSDIAVYSRAGSIDAGTSTPFSDESVFVDASGVVRVSYQGGGIFANGGNVGLFAKQDIRIGAGITGAGITIDAGGSLLGSGAGGISGSNVNINVSGTITGNISATGSINVSGGTVSGGSANLSAGGLVAGAGAGVGSNTGSGKVSAELNDLQDRAAEVGSASFQTAHAIASDQASHGVVIQVSSCVLGEVSDPSKKCR